MPPAISLARARNRLAFALDYPTLAEARGGAEAVAGVVGVLKVGLELFVREGPAAVALGGQLGCDVFLDLKLHDIPQTVDHAVASAIGLGTRYLTVHAAGGAHMIERAANRVVTEAADTTLLAVTVLTSLDAADLERVGVPSPPAEQAMRLGLLALEAGAGGLVCSAREVAAIRSAVGPEPVLATPGVRPATTHGVDDQKRTGTPASAIRGGASLLVVGRPIRDAPDPAGAARAIAHEIVTALP